MSLSNKTVLITGVSGYIGSNMTQLLLQNNFKVIGIDNLINSFPLKIIHPNFQFIKADIAQKKIINKIFLKQTIDAVIYLCASAEIELSMNRAINFYKNNIVNTLNFIEIMQKNQPECNFIFSSTVITLSSPYGLYLPSLDHFSISVYGITIQG